ncbi:hypothetical protein ACFQYP_00765 [Nonomuraea antimicrobica]
MSSIAPGVAVIIRRRKRTATLERELSVRAAVRRFNDVAPYTISDMKWGRIEGGKVETVSDIDLAWMAYVVGATSDELVEAGAPGAAELLPNIIAQRNADAEAAGIDMSLTSEVVQRQLQERIREIRSLKGVTKDEKERIEQFMLSQMKLALEQAHLTVQMLDAR